MRLLVIGGTKFVGRHLVEEALRRGLDVTVFTRGLTNPGLHPAAEHLAGDRDSDVSALEGREFDAVVDTCGYHPRGVALTAGVVRSPSYCFVSTISVYADARADRLDEASPLASLDGDLPAEFEPDLYGPLKVLCEREVEAVFGDRALVVRPGLIVGPHDSSDRFTYWPARAARGGTILAPGRPGRHVQVIDARDLAAWMLDMIDRGSTGIYNTVGPAQPVTMADLLGACARAAGVASDVEWVDEAWLLEQKVEPWIELPVWLPEDGEHAGLFRADASRAIGAGLTFRPLLDTARDTLEWDRARGPGERKAGMDPEREADLLRAWKERG